jgi:hypothetical protein
MYMKFQRETILVWECAPEEACAGGDMFELTDLETLSASNHHEQ